MNDADSVQNCNLCDNLIHCNGKSFGLKGVYKRIYEPWQFFEGKKNSLIWIVGINQGFNEGQRDLNSLYPKIDKKGNSKHWNTELNFPENSTLNELENIFENKWKQKLNPNPYYLTFHKLYPLLYNWMGEEYGVASTEAIRCGSVKHDEKAHLGYSLEEIYRETQANDQEKRTIKKQWKITKEKIRENCSYHFKKLMNHSEYNLPVLIICNGKPACHTVANILLTPSEQEKVAKDNSVNNIFSVPVYEAEYRKNDITHSLTVIQSDFLGRLPSDLSRNHVGYTIRDVIERLELVELKKCLTSSKH